MELKVTQERVKAAAAKCGDAKRVLQELFPEVFEDDQRVWIGLNSGVIEDVDLVRLIERRAAGEYQNRALWLTPTHNWELRKDPGIAGMLLIPTKKGV